MTETCLCGTNPQGNETTQIPRKIGQPLSTACQRVSTIGSIPEVLIYPGVSLVDGGLITLSTPNGGISNMSSFFKSRVGCYAAKDARLSASTCN